MEENHGGKVVRVCVGNGTFIERTWEERSAKYILSQSFTGVIAS